MTVQLINLNFILAWVKPNLLNKPSLIGNLSFIEEEVPVRSTYMSSKK
jgi:hypothetical protein